jgi:hypothetical protein
VLPVCVSAQAAANPVKHADASVFLYAHPRPGEVISDIAFHVIAISGPGIEERVTRAGGMGSLAILNIDAPDAVKWKGSFRMDGMVVCRMPSENSVKMPESNVSRASAGFQPAVELSSHDLGTVAGRERKYMSVLQHPAVVAVDQQCRHGNSTQLGTKIRLGEHLL